MDAVVHAEPEQEGQRHEVARLERDAAQDDHAERDTEAGRDGDQRARRSHEVARAGQHDHDYDGPG